MNGNSPYSAGWINHLMKCSFLYNCLIKCSFLCNYKTMIILMTILITLPPRILCMCIFFFFHSSLSSSLFWLLEESNHFVFVYFPLQLPFLIPWWWQLFRICVFASSAIFFYSLVMEIILYLFNCVISSPALFFDSLRMAIISYLCICLSTSIFRTINYY